MMTREQVEDRLTACARLEADWDSYGAAPIHPDALAEARVLIETVERRHDTLPYHLCPIPYGGMTVEYRGPVWRIEADMGGDGRYGALVVKPDLDAERRFEDVDKLTASAVAKRVREVLHHV